MKPETAAWLANVRANAAPLGTSFVIVHGPAGSVAITPGEITSRSDDELLAFIVGRLKESSRGTAA